MDHRYDAIVDSIMRAVKHAHEPKEHGAAIEHLKAATRAASQYATELAVTKGAAAAGEFRKEFQQHADRIAKILSDRGTKVDMSKSDGCKHEMLKSQEFCKCGYLQKSNSLSEESRADLLKTFSEFTEGESRDALLEKAAKFKRRTSKLNKAKILSFKTGKVLADLPSNETPRSSTSEMGTNGVASIKPSNDSGMPKPPAPRGTHLLSVGHVQVLHVSKKEHQHQVGIHLNYPEGVEDHHIIGAVGDAMKDSFPAIYVHGKKPSADVINSVRTHFGSDEAIDKSDLEKAKIYSFKTGKMVADLPSGAAAKPAEPKQLFTSPEEKKTKHLEAALHHASWWAGHQGMHDHMGSSGSYDMGAAADDSGDPENFSEEDYLKGMQEETGHLPKADKHLKMMKQHLKAAGINDKHFLNVQRSGGIPHPQIDDMDPDSYKLLDHANSARPGEEHSYIAGTHISHFGPGGADSPIKDGHIASYAHESFGDKHPMDAHLPSPSGGAPKKKASK